MWEIESCFVFFPAGCAHYSDNWQPSFPPLSIIYLPLCVFGQAVCGQSSSVGGLPPKSRSPSSPLPPRSCFRRRPNRGKQPSEEEEEGEKSVSSLPSADTYKKRSSRENKKGILSLICGVCSDSTLTGMLSDLD